MIVIDASLVVGWLLQEKETEGTEHLYERAISAGAVGPLIFAIEATNALRTNLRRNKITLERRNVALQLLTRIGVQIRPTSEQPSIEEIVELSDRHDITTYDASYVALARLHKLPLATLDQAMARAARAEGLAVLP